MSFDEENKSNKINQFNLFLDVDFRVKKRYNDCLEKQAVQRLRMMRSIESDQAKQIVREVFYPCRYDLAPFGEEPKLLANKNHVFNDYERFRRWSKKAK